MIMLILVTTLILNIPASRSQSQLIKPQKLQQLFPLSCTNDTVKISLFAIKHFGVRFNRTELEQNNVKMLIFQASIADQKVAPFKNGMNRLKSKINISNNNDDKKFNQESTIDIDVEIHARYMNHTFLQYSIKVIYLDENVDYINCFIDIHVTEPKRLRDKIFYASLPFLIIFISIQMGILLDLGVLKEIILRPTQVFIGFCCQCGLMPLIAFSITKIFQYPPLYGLALFVIGCCPGGTASNQWTVMFDGDLTLSALMSFASTVTSFFMMPLWLYTLGQYAYLRDLNIHIPFLDLAKSLVMVVVPLVLGMLVAYCIPKTKKIIEYIIKPVLLLTIFFYFGFGTYVNYFLISYVDLRTALTAPLLPWLGYVLGAGVAWICGQDWKRMKTIGIETGIQNIGIGVMILMYSIPSPHNIQSIAVPLVVAYLSLQPFYIILIIKTIRQKCCQNKSKQEQLLPTDNYSSKDQTTQQLIESKDLSDTIIDKKVTTLPPISTLHIALDTDKVEV